MRNKKFNRTINDYAIGEYFSWNESKTSHKVNDYEKPLKENQINRRLDWKGDFDYNNKQKKSVAFP